MATSVRRSVLVVLAFVASLVFTAFTAPASLAAGEVAASWGTDCATIEVSSSGWPADDFVHVRWYATADSATPGVDGEAWWPVNQAWSKPVDPSRVRGFSYRIVSPGGNGGGKASGTGYTHTLAAGRHTVQTRNVPSGKRVSAVSVGTTG